MKKILIFKIGAIGDILMTTPFLSQLKNSGKYSIDFLCGNGSKTILEGSSCIDNLIFFDESFFRKITPKNLFLYIKFLLFLFKLRLKNKYNYVIILDKHIVFNFSFRITLYKNRFGFNRLGKEGKFLNKTIYWNKTKREVEYYLDFLNLLDIKPNYKKQKYHFFSDIILKLKNKKLDTKELNLLMEFVKNKKNIDNFIGDLKKKGKKIIGIATGGGNLLMPKNDCRWRNLENWRNLALKLIDLGYEVVLLGSGHDRKIDIKSTEFHDLLGKYKIHETIYLVSQLDLVVSQEAGFIHFVGCTDTNLITIAGPTNPYRFHPYNDLGDPQQLGYLWKEKVEHYDEYGSFNKCTGKEIDKVTVDDVLSLIFNLKINN